MSQIRLADGSACGTVLHKGNRVGRIEARVAGLTFVWYQTPVAFLSDERTRTFAMEESLYETLADRDVASVAIRDAHRVPLDQLADGEPLLPTDSRWHMQPDELQYTISVAADDLEDTHE